MLHEGGLGVTRRWYDGNTSRYTRVHKGYAKVPGLCTNYNGITILLYYYNERGRDCVKDRVTRPYGPG